MILTMTFIDKVVDNFLYIKLEIENLVFVKIKVNLNPNFDRSLKPANLSQKRHFVF